ncbi:MAG: chlorite dismutase family protein [Tepidisphaerales bacterium]
MTQATHPGAVPGSRPHGAAAGGPVVQRQMVSFSFYKLDPAFRRLDAGEKASARDEFITAAAALPQGLICLNYSTVGTRADTDICLWRIGAGLDEIQAHQAALNRTKLAGWLHQPHSLLSMTKRSMYIEKLDPFHTAESRAVLIPGKRKYIFIYPFVKTREWYLLPMEKRQELMDEHIKVGNEFPSVKLNTTYSFGLDDQDFVVAFETEEPKDFLDLVMKLRETQGSRYTVRDTPVFTGVQMPIERILDQLF